MSIFEKWNLETSILDAIKSRGWTEPTEIQIDAIPFARKGRDIVGQAKTGSGKTAAFGIPIIEALKLEVPMVLSNLKIFKEITENKSSIDIADKLNVSNKTIQNHRFNICKKMKHLFNI